MNTEDVMPEAEEIDAETMEMLTRAAQLEEEGSRDEALECWRIAVARYPADAQLLCQYADLATDLELWSEAEETYFSVIRLAPEWVGGYEALGALYLDRNGEGDSELALRYLQRAAEMEESAHAYTYLGYVQDRLGQRIEARVSYHAALRMDPSYEEALYNLGVSYRDEDPEESLTLFTKAIEVDSRYQSAFRELGWAEYRLDRLDAAERHIRKAIELDDADGWAQIYLGQLLARKGDGASAEVAFLKALEVWQDTQDVGFALRLLAMFYQSTGRPNEAELFFEKSLQFDPSDPRSNLRFGIYLRDIGDTERARLYLERAVALDPGDRLASSTLSELGADTTARNRLDSVN
ncbi:MAG TPA: tetratricopeptide repeat protein [Blastocatellia bacterium]|nr:tetratricopeptide repeat protein [Blastocatellia bacterium]